MNVIPYNHNYTIPSTDLLDIGPLVSVVIGIHEASLDFDGAIKLPECRKHIRRRLLRKLMREQVIAMSKINKIVDRTMQTIEDNFIMSLNKVEFNV